MKRRGRPFCLGCEYDLSGCPGPQCPECGRPFNYENPASYGVVGSRLHGRQPQPQRTLSSHIGILVTCGAVMCGLAGLLTGFFGPLHYTPGANQGPLVGIFFSGPLGVVIGAVFGAGLGVIRQCRISAGVVVLALCSAGYGGFVLLMLALSR